MGKGKGGKREKRGKGGKGETGKRKHWQGGIDIW